MAFTKTISKIEEVSVDKWEKKHCVAVMADNHIGLPKQFNATGERTQFIFNATIRLAEALARYSNILVIAGDFLDKRRFVEAPLIAKTKKLMFDICTRFDHVYLLVGNHEFTGHEHTVLDVFRHMNLPLTIVDKPRVIGGKILLFPFLGDDYEHIVEKWGSRVSDYPYCIGHWPVMGAEINGGTVPKGLPLSFFSGKITILGDVHKAQVMDTMLYSKDKQGAVKHLAYVGAPIQHNFGEEGNPCGGIVLNAKKEINRAVRVEIDPEFSFHTVEIDNPADVDDLNTYINGAYRIVCATPEIRAEVERRIADGIAYTTVLKRVTKPDVRLKSVLAHHSLDKICLEYLREIRKDIAQEQHTLVMQNFKRILDVTSGSAE